MFGVLPVLNVSCCRNLAGLVGNIRLCSSIVIPSRVGL